MNSVVVNGQKAGEPIMLALITGASSGIGEALAHEHARHGGNLILVARREAKLQEIQQTLQEKHQVQVEVIAKDLTQPSAPQELFDEVQSKNLTVDYLINNAGFGGQGYFHERDWQKDEQMIQLNITALTELTRLFLPAMVERNSGRVLQVASSAALVPAGPLQSVYFATKAYVLSLSQGIAGELMDTNVTVTALCPGPIATEFIQTAGVENTPMFAKAIGPEQVARESYQAMLKGKLICVSGVPLWNRIQMKLGPHFLPRKMLLGMIKNMQETSH
ncbi:MAG: SDR family oxidoreductase [Pirellulales bacterium]|nr:SDR family oxidoreductase [Pirellulales bacterium]